jgi:hypothetical protein
VSDDATPSTIAGPVAIADRRWGWAGAIAGVTAILSYALVIVVPGPPSVLALLTLGFGAGLTVASLGLYFAVAASAAPRMAVVAVVSNVVAAGELVAMILVQLAIQSSGETAGRGLSAVYLGLDVAWDLYVGVGTFAFAFALRRHRGFGGAFGWPGMTLAVLLLGLNIATFPTPPGNAGLVDLGPAVALWYVAVSVQLVRRLRQRRAAAA